MIPIRTRENISCHKNTFSCCQVISQLDNYRFQSSCSIILCCNCSTKCSQSCRKPNQPWRQHCLSVIKSGDASAEGVGTFLLRSRKCSVCVAGVLNSARRPELCSTLCLLLLLDSSQRRSQSSCSQINWPQSSLSLHNLLCSVCAVLCVPFVVIFLSVSH